MSSLEKLKPGAHSCGDSRLKCNDCDEQICPKCFVPCAVGNRCKKCAGRFTSHVLQVPAAVLVRTLGFTILLGFLFGYIEPIFARMAFGFYGYLGTLAICYLIGKLVHRVAGYKLGAKITLIIMAGLILGMLLGPIRNELMTALSLSNGGEEDQLVGKNMLTDLGCQAFLFILGILLPLFRR